MHLEIRDWHTHGHAIDPNYNQTILHVVLWPPNKTKKHTLHSQIYKANGEIVPTIIVQPYLSLPLEKLLALFQQADERKQQKLQQCRKTLEHTPWDWILLNLQELGQERLYERARRFKLWLKHASFQQVLYEAICEGLGYTSNQRSFVKLARCLPLAEIMSHLPKQDYDHTINQLRWIQAMLFGASGLLPLLEELPGMQKSLLCHTIEPETIEYITELRSLWDMLAPCLNLKPLKYEDWHFFRLRPQNFPTRRIAALSYLILSYCVQPLFESYFQLFDLLSKHPEHRSDNIRLLERTLEVPTTDYWKGRYVFGKPVFPDHDRMFLGQSRIRDIVISAILPVFLLYALQTSRPKLESQILALYNIFPAPNWNRVTKTVSTQLFEHREIPITKIRTANIYQGMLQLYKHYCYLPACENCPFGGHEKDI